MKRGATRYVFLIGKYAIKIPSFYSWQLFLCGLLANMQEANFWRQLKRERMCPVLIACRGGFFLIMPKAEPLLITEFENLDFDKFINAGIPVEYKQSSFGKYQGRIVAIDYGS